MGRYVCIQTSSFSLVFTVVLPFDHFFRSGRADAKEMEMVERLERSRERKNNRSRERANEIKEKVDAIMAKPAEIRSKREVHFLEIHRNRKIRKNEGDRLRRRRIKELGLDQRSKGDDHKPPCVTARGPLPLELQQKLAQRGKEARLQPAGSPPRDPYNYPSALPPYQVPSYPNFAPPPPPPPHVIMEGETGFTIAPGRAGYPPPDAYPWKAPAAYEGHFGWGEAPETRELGEKEVSPSKTKAV